jgi:hypothetical protein
VVSQPRCDPTTSGAWSAYAVGRTPCRWYQRMRRHRDDRFASMAVRYRQNGNFRSGEDPMRAIGGHGG